MDKKAISLLRKSGRNTLTDAEIRYCIEQEVLWIPEGMTHDDCIRQIKSLAAEIPLERAVSAFLYSVESSDFRYRTILHSLLIAQAMPEHSPVLHGKCTCAICGLPYNLQTQTAQPDMFEASRCRLLPETKFMDIYRTDYLLNDLHAFQALPEVHYGEECFRILNRILGLAKTLAPANKVNALLKSIAAEESLSLTKADAFSILGVLSVCGVFDTPDYRSDCTAYVNWNDRDFTYESDVYYPLHQWKAKYGIRYEAIREVFGKEIAEKLSPASADTQEVQRTAPKKSKSAIEAEAFFAGFQRPFVLDNSMRYYYGLSPMQMDWDRVILANMRDGGPDCTELYFDGDVIRKMVRLECDRNGRLYYFSETDMDTPTNARQTILPKTERGREQPLTYSALQIHEQTVLCIYRTKDSFTVKGYNHINHWNLPLPEKTIPELYLVPEYTAEYIRSCPPSYEEFLHDYRTKKSQRVKYHAGDIFRVQLSPNLFTYCLILGDAQKIAKWEELPLIHPLRSLGDVSMIYRQYAIVTERLDMTPEKLQQIPLMPMQNCYSDHDITNGMHPIIGHKMLEESDIDLGFHIYKSLNAVAWGMTTHTFSKDPCGIFSLSFSGRTSHWRGIQNNGFTAGEIPIPEHPQAEAQRLLIEHYGFSEDTAVDEFAKKFGGMTRAEFIALAEKRKL